MALPKPMVISGKPCGSIQLSASASFDITGGGFFSADSTAGTANMTVATNSVVTGYVDFQADPNDANLSGNVLTVPSTTSDKYRFNYYTGDFVVRMPVKSGQTVAVTHSGLLCDIDVTSNKQTVDLASTSTTVLQVLPVSEEDIALNMVRVRINPAKIGRA